MKDAIKGAAEKYAGINRIIFYVNKEISASSRKTEDQPKFQGEIEEAGKTYGIKVEWRVLSHLEKMLMDDGMEIIRDLYFNPNDGIGQFEKRIQQHGQAIIDHIQSEIKYDISCEEG